MQDLQPIDTAKSVAQLELLIAKASSAKTYTVVDMAAAVAHFEKLPDPLYGQAAYRFSSDDPQTTHTLTRGVDGSVIEITQAAVIAELLVPNARFINEPNKLALVCMLDGETYRLSYTDDYETPIFTLLYALLTAAKTRKIPVTKIDLVIDFSKDIIIAFIKPENGPVISCKYPWTT